MTNQKEKQMNHYKPVHKFPYEWTLKDANFTKDKGTVFSCFACGGGSTMGYKLSGFDVIGCNEIDPKMAKCYKANHNPKYCFIEPIQTFKDRDDLPEELYHLDILDGSPPCSSFSMAGNREKDWGKEKKFREGQAEQVLDTLFFDFIELGKKLQPKVIIAENVKGLLLGDAKKYVSKIMDAFDDAGYFVDFTLLDASKMGVPQRRERVFFHAIRKDLYKGGFSDLFGTRPVLDLVFNEAKIQFKEVYDITDTENTLRKCEEDLWEFVKPTDKNLSEAYDRRDGKNGYFGHAILHLNDVSPTITGNSGGQAIIYEAKRHINNGELFKCGAYPSDYVFIDTKPKYLIGMSVPPVMTAQIATRIHDQWLTAYPDTTERNK